MWVIYDLILWCGLYYASREISIKESIHTPHALADLSAYFFGWESARRVKPAASSELHVVSLEKL